MKLENTLHHESSPYLKQHAANPVHWQPWNQKTLQLAIKLNKPILLSIGYSACHWCHVMAHESFEDPETAELMNQDFINIKVDREERPDLDKIYQASHSLLTGQPGGWPLTVFLTPDDQIPFFAGTYFPKNPHYNLPAFSEILSRVNDIYQNRMDDIKEQHQSLLGMLHEANTTSKAPDNNINTLPIDLVRQQIENSFDPVNGGFSKAPKFPHPGILERLLRHYTLLKQQATPDDKALEMALFTLSRMAQSGIFDQPGGGFFRYSTDDNWMIPHFEKMLYDNAQLIDIYTRAYHISKNPFFSHIAGKIAQWIINEMQSSSGGFYSAQDADTDHEEGKFYLWQAEQIKQIIPEQHFNIFAKYYGLDQAANFEGQWHLHGQNILDKLVETSGLSTNEINSSLDESNALLYRARQQRKKPDTDQKILTAWNALMIKGLTYTGRILNQQSFIGSAKHALFFIKNALWHKQRLLACYSDGKAYLNGYLDDYAFLLQAQLEFLQCQWNNDIFDWAQEVANAMLNYFEDTEHGGFFFTSHDHEHLIQRLKTFSDEATPSGNAICAQSLIKLGLLTGNPHYITAAENCIKSGMNSINQNAIMHTSMINALEDLTHLATVIIIRGNDQELGNCKKALDLYQTDRIMYFLIHNEIQLTDKLSDKKPAGTLCIYICEGMSCQQPLTTIEQLKQHLETRHEIRQPLQ